MLLGGAAVLIVLVVAGTAAVMLYDLRFYPRGEWHNAIKQWQSLLGAVLGLLGAAAVLVLSAEFQAQQQRQSAEQQAHAIGLGLALEAERIAVGLRGGIIIGNGIDVAAAEGLGETCRSYVATLRRVLAPDTPVYDAVLPRMVDFGDSNLAIFVRFYALYGDLLREIVEIGETSCETRGADEITYVVRQLERGMQFYGIIAERYGTVPPEATAGVEES